MALAGTTELVRHIQYLANERGFKESADKMRELARDCGIDDVALHDFALDVGDAAQVMLLMGSPADALSGAFLDGVLFGLSFRESADA